MATVHPYKGYLNSKFHLYAKGIEDVEYEVYSNKKVGEPPVIKGSFLPSIPHTINLNEAGSFRIDFSDGTTSEIMVEDGYKFGGSAYKNSFIFDDLPWCFVIMNDRTYFYNRETEECYMELISPDKINIISKDYVIFENNGQEERTVYSLHEQKPILNIPDIVTFNDQVVVWQEMIDGNIRLNIYSLSDRIIKKSINVKEFIVDTEDNSITYSTENTIYKQVLTLPLSEEQTLNICGKFVTFVSPNLVISIEPCYNFNKIYLFDTCEGKTISHINTYYQIASINSKIFLDESDINERIENIKTFDFTSIGCEEASIKVSYLSLNFYPTKWDVYCSEKKYTYERSIRKSTNIYSYKIISILSEKEFIFNNDINPNSVILQDDSICFSNYNECLIMGKSFSPVYSSNAKIFKHGNKVINQTYNSISILDNKVGWKPIYKDNCSCQYFNEFGIITDNSNKVYFDLLGNRFTGLSVVFNVPFKHLRINDKIIMPNGQILPNLEIKRAANGLLNYEMSLSESGKLGLMHEEDGIFLLFIEKDKIRRKKILTDLYDTTSYESVLLSEDGYQILYRNTDITRVIDIVSGETFDFGNVSYVQQVNGMRPQFQRSGALQPRIVNPVTGQMLDSDNMKQYNFISPDGTLYADTRLKEYVEYYWRIDNTSLSYEEYNKLLEKYTYPRQERRNSQAWENVKNYRKAFIQEHFKYFNDNFPKLFHNDSTGNHWENSVLDEEDQLGALYFLDRIIGKKGIAYIRRSSDDSIFAKIELGEPLTYINYVSFSYDSKYMALAGYRGDSSSLGRGLFLIYNLIDKSVIAFQNTGRAVWVTAFSKSNALASYTSNPFTFFVKNEGEYFFEDFNSKLINGKSFLTFSPDGLYFALSQQGYISKYDRYGDINCEWGHQPSSLVEIRSVRDSEKQLIQFQDLSDAGIADVANLAKNVAAVSFSNDNKKLMMVGNDGVVVIRNLHLDENAGE